MLAKGYTKFNTFLGKQLLTDPKYRIARHIIFSLGLILLYYWEMVYIYQPGSRWFPVIRSSIISLSVIYLNIYVLVPLFLLKRWYWVYLLTVIYAMLLVYFAEMLLADVIYLKVEPKIMALYGKIAISPILQVLASVTSIGILIISSSVVALFRKWTAQELHFNTLERTAVQTELEQLKTQINPQFLITLLDKAKTLSVKNEEEASEVLLKLGSILRYQLYDSSRESVLLSADIQFLTNFLNMEKKCCRNLRFSVQLEGDINNCLVPPLLFIPFVEQTVAAINDEDSPAHIAIFFRVNGIVLDFECRFECEDVYLLSIQKTDDGLNNIHRRLTLLYGHLYTIGKSYEGTTQIVRLHLNHISYPFFKEEFRAS